MLLCLTCISLLWCLLKSRSSIVFILLANVLNIPQLFFWFFSYLLIVFFKAIMRLINYLHLNFSQFLTLCSPHSKTLFTFLLLYIQYDMWWSLSTSPHNTISSFYFEIISFLWPMTIFMYLFLSHSISFEVIFFLQSMAIIIYLKVKKNIDNYTIYL